MFTAFCCIYIAFTKGRCGGIGLLCFLKPLTPWLSIHIKTVSSKQTKWFIFVLISKECFGPNEGTVIYYKMNNV